MLEVARDLVFHVREPSPGLVLRKIAADAKSGVDDGRTAGSLDSRIRRLACEEARIRRALGRLASVFLSRRRHHGLGFSRLSDYGHERLGISAPELRTLAKVADGLDRFPATADAYLRGELSWTKVRLILPVLSPETEPKWIARAALLTTRELDEEIREATEKTDDESTDETAAKEASATLEDLSTEDGKTIDGERAVRFRRRCSRRLHRIWKKVTEFARRMAGEHLCPWRAAECIAAEGLSGAPVDRIEDAIERVEDRTASQASAQTAHKLLFLHRAIRPSPRGDDLTVAGLARDVPGVDLPGLDDSLCNDAIRTAGNPADLGPHDLDLHMRALVSALQRIHWTAGRLLRIAGDLRIYRQLGFSSLVEYAKDRLGISSPRKIHALVSLDRKTSTLGEVSSAYREGRLSWSRVLAILPAIDREGGNASAWVERARSVVIRRLRDEVDWASGTAGAAAFRSARPGGTFTTIT